MSLSSSPWASGLLAVLLIYLFGAPTATPDPTPAAPAPRGTTTTRLGHEAARAPGSDLAESAVSLMPAPASRVGLIGLATLLVAFAVVFVLSGRRTGARTRADRFRARR